MEELNKALRTALADTFFMYFKAQAFHWNVEGILFSQYHDFFGKIYEEVYSAVDPMAEEIRAIGFYAPMSLPELYADKSLEETNQPTDVRQMVSSLLAMNTGVLASLNAAFRLADSMNQQGVADFIAGRIDCHKKHEWTLSASLKG